MLTLSEPPLVPTVDLSHLLLLPYSTAMSQSGPPADAKQAQAAALQELEAAQKRKRAIDTSLVSYRDRTLRQTDTTSGQLGGIHLCVRGQLS